MGLDQWNRFTPAGNFAKINLPHSSLKLPFLRPETGGELDMNKLEWTFRAIQERSDEQSRYINRTEFPDTEDGSCAPVAIASSGFFSGTISAPDTTRFDDSTLGGGGSSVDLSGDMTYDGPTGVYTVPRDGMYATGINVSIDGTGLADPYWVSLIAGTGGAGQLLAPYSSSLTYGFNTFGYYAAGSPIIFAIANNLTASSSIDFELGSAYAVEIPCSTIGA